MNPIDHLMFYWGFYLLPHSQSITNIAHNSKADDCEGAANFRDWIVKKRGKSSSGQPTYEMR